MPPPLYNHILPIKAPSPNNITLWYTRGYWLQHVNLGGKRFGVKGHNSAHNRRNAVNHGKIMEKAMHPTPVLLPGKSHGWRSLVGYSPWARKELDMTEWLHFLYFYSSFQRRKWQTTPVFLPGESHGQRGLVGYGLWGCKESDMTK